MDSAMARDQSGSFINLHKSSNNDLLYTFVDILLCEDKVSHIQKFFSRFWFSLRSQLRLGNSEVRKEKRNQDSESSNQQFCFDNKRDNMNLCREDVEMVMGSLGMFCSPESEKLTELMGSDELAQLFDEKEPSLGELKEAFDVFDENRDGFIDAKELQRILCILGLKEGLELENCRKMIRAYDQNRDGRIDFNEFVKFLEQSLS